MLKLGAGWLARSNRTDSNVGTIAIDRAKFPTRFEEYNFVLDTLAALPRGLVVDAGSGFNPEIHVLPYALDEAGWYVIATDGNAEALNMAPRNHVVRYLEDITSGWHTRHLEVDVYCCISTLEHLQPTQQLVLLETAFATLRPGGIAVFTTDLMAPERLNGLFRYAGFEVGEVEAFRGEHLVPRVAYGVARKPEVIRE